MRIEDSLRRVESVAAAERLFERRSSAEALRNFLERCDEILVTNSAEGLRMAHFGCSVASRLDDVEQMASAFAVLGAAHRRIGAFALSEDAFTRGLRLASRSGGLARADLLQRRALLRAQAGQFLAALADADEAVAGRRKLSRFGIRECETLPCALVVRAHVYCAIGEMQKSLNDNIEALTVTTPALTPRTYSLALSNVDSLQENASLSVEEVAWFIRMIKGATKRLTPRHAFERLKLQWVLANQLRRLGSTRKAEKILLKIRPGLLRVHLREFLCASLDLADICRFHGDEKTLEVVLEEMASATASTPNSGIEAGILLAAAAARHLDAAGADRLRALLKGQPIGTT
jgi:tetratricopeptide (TPR) repeat protein